MRDRSKIAMIVALVALVFIIPVNISSLFHFSFSSFRQLLPMLFIGWFIYRLASGRGCCGGRCRNDQAEEDAPEGEDGQGES